LAPSAALERKKDPEGVRAALLDAAATLIADQGLARLTVDAVARSAGVTKGGLFHHFASKQDLIDGVLDLMTQAAEESMNARMADDPEPYGRFTRAYLSGVFAENRPTACTSSSAICVGMIADPALQQRWTNWVAEQVARHAATDDNDACAVVRLAADGIWLSSLRTSTGSVAISASLQAKLIALTYPSSA